MVSLSLPMSRVAVFLGEDKRGRQGPGSRGLVWRGRIQVKQCDGWAKGLKVQGQMRLLNVPRRSSFLKNYVGPKLAWASRAYSVQSTCQH